MFQTPLYNDSLFLPMGSPTSSSLSQFSPVSDFLFTPYNNSIVTTHVSNNPLDSVFSVNTPVDVLSVISPLNTSNIDVGLNSSWLVQKDATQYLLFRMLDKWLYKDELCHLLKYLVVSDGKVNIVESKEQYKNVKICTDSVEDIEKKSDFIQKNILGQKEMRHILMRMINEVGYKWYQLSQPKYEQVVVEVVEKFLRKKLRALIGTNTN
jgi:hypothetical protein